jgi:hypothetical protein
MTNEIYSVSEYRKKFELNGKFWSSKTIIRRCKKNQLPTNHSPKMVGRIYVIEVVTK